MIAIVAPYTGYGTDSEVRLGASKKLRFIISVLHQIDSELILINSAHNGTEPTELRNRTIDIAGISLTEILPPTYRSKPFGKFLNLFDVKATLKALSELGSPKMIWLYNGYAFEMLFMRYAERIFKCPFILEFEDWHFSRNRGLNIKPMVDFTLWKSVVRKFTRVYAVNFDLYKRVKPYCDDVHLLPGTVQKELINVADHYEPFTRSGGDIHIGYFGGLRSEKGADIVLKMSQSLSDSHTLHVTGTGELQSSFIEESRSSNTKLRYHGLVDDNELLNIISQCDIILNPHAPLDQFSNGLFPSKIIEAIASKRLLISTRLSFDGFPELADGIIFAEYSLNGFMEAVSESPAYYQNNLQTIKKASQIAADRFGESALIQSLKLLLKNRQ